MEKVFNFVYKKQVYIAIIFVFIISILLLIKTSSIYKSIDDNDNEEYYADIVDSNGMQVIIRSVLDDLKLDNVESSNYEKEKDKLGYYFSIENSSNEDILYYEVRIVNNEYSNSNLAFKYLDYFVSTEDETVTTYRNLGLDDGLIYEGFNLKTNETKELCLNIWVNEDYEKSDNKLIGNIEVTLYKEDQSKNYIYYSCEDLICPRRTIKDLGITKYIPDSNKEFIGWSYDEKIVSSINNITDNKIVLSPVFKES